MNQITINGFTRVSKSRARDLYDAGSPVYFVPCKMRPGAPWNPETQILKARTQCGFQDVINSATYYLCGGAAGRYLAYYVRQETAA